MQGERKGESIVPGGGTRKCDHLQFSFLRKNCQYFWGKKLFDYNPSCKKRALLFGIEYENVNTEQCKGVFGRCAKHLELPLCIYSASVFKDSQLFVKNLQSMLLCKQLLEITSHADTISCGNDSLLSKLQKWTVWGHKRNFQECECMGHQERLPLAVEGTLLLTTGYSLHKCPPVAHMLKLGPQLDIIRRWQKL